MEVRVNRLDIPGGKKDDAHRAAVISYVLRSDLLRRHAIRDRITAAALAGETGGRFTQRTFDTFLILADAYLTGQSLIHSDVHILSDVPRSTARRSLARLSRLGALASRTDPEDQRRRFVGLTPRFCELLDQIIDECVVEFSELIALGDRGEREKAESALAESEARFRDFAASAADRFWETDADNRITYISEPDPELGLPGAEEIVGHIHGEVEGVDQDADLWRAHLADIAQRSPFRDYRLRRQGPDGRIVHLRLNGKPVFDEDGVFKGYRGTLIDETREVEAREEAEKALRESEARLMAILENSPFGVVVASLSERKRFFVNSRYVEMSGGQSRDEFLAGDFVDSFTDPNVFRRHWSAFRRDNHLAGTEAQRRRLDGSTWWCLYDWRPFLHEGEEAVIIWHHDITELKEREARERRFMAALDESPEGISLWDADDRLIAYNRRYRESRPEMAGILVPGIGFADYIRQQAEIGRPLDAVGREAQWIAERLAGRLLAAAEHQSRVGDRWYNIRETRLADGDRIAFHTDITERKAEDAARQKYLHALDSAPDGIILWDADDRLVLHNRKHAELHPGPAAHLTPGMGYRDYLFHLVESGYMTEARGREADFIAAHLERHHHPHSDYEIDRQGRSIHVRKKRLPDGSTISFHTDVTDAKAAQARERDARAKLTDAIESISGRVSLYDADDRFVLCNSRFRDDYPGLADFLVPGTPFETIIRESVRRYALTIVTGDPEAWIDERLRRHRELGSSEIRLRDGSWLQVDEYRTHDGGTLIIRTDITERKEAEARLHASLAEKETLIREAQHRVKNNFQLIAGLLYQQSGLVDKPEVRDALTQSSQRIQAMGRIHEALYATGDLSDVAADDYLGGIVDGVIEEANFQEHEITRRLEIDPIMLTGEHAIICGLIVNELLGNALKHGFAGGRSGSVEISLRRAEGGRLALSVANDGLPLPNGFDMGATGTLGLTLISALAHQLDAAVTVDTRPLTRFTLTFKDR